MKRWVNTITICILIGAIINVAIAWWFAIRMHASGALNSDPVIQSGVSFVGSESAEWNVVTQSSLGTTHSVSFIANRSAEFGERVLTAEEALPYYWAEYLRLDPDTISMYSQALYEDALACGWPFRAMMMIAGPRFDPEDKFLRGILWDAPTWIRGRPIAPPSQSLPIYLPLKIIWPGFIANTLLYSIVPFLIFIMKFKLRGYLRLKRKQCNKCGYPTGQSQVCTECGTQLIPEHLR